MGSRSPSRRSACLSHEKAQGTARSRGGTSTEKRGESSRDFRTSPRSDKSPSHGSRRSSHPHNESKRERSDSPIRERSSHRERQSSNSPGSSYRDKSLEEKSNGRPIFRGPDGGGAKFDIKELKRITVNIKRSLPKKEKVVIQRTITNPEAITPVRRPDEGSRPIFARPELLAGPRENSQERRRVGTRESLENDLHHKRERTVSPRSGHYQQSSHKKKDSSSYDAKRHRTRSPINHSHRNLVRKESIRNSESRSHDDRHRPQDRNNKSSRTSRSRDRERSKSNSDRHRRHHSPSPSSNRRRRRSDSWDRSKQNDKERYKREDRHPREREERHPREREERRSRRDSSRERYREQNESNNRTSLQASEEYVEEYPHMSGGLIGPRLFRPIRPMMMAPPMMAYRPPVPHIPPPWMIRPGFRPRPPPFAPPRFMPPY